MCHSGCGCPSEDSALRARLGLWLRGALPPHFFLEACKSGVGRRLGSRSTLPGRGSWPATPRVACLVLSLYLRFVVCEGHSCLRGLLCKVFKTVAGTW